MTDTNTLCFLYDSCGSLDQDPGSLNNWSSTFENRLSLFQAFSFAPIVDVRAQLFSLVPRECAFSLLNGAEKRGNSVTPRKRERERRRTSLKSAPGRRRTSSGSRS